MKKKPVYDEVFADSEAVAEGFFSGSSSSILDFLLAGSLPSSAVASESLFADEESSSVVEGFGLLADLDSSAEDEDVREDLNLTMTAVMLSQPVPSPRVLGAKQASKS